MPAAPYREALTLHSWQARFQKALATRFGLRLHMTLVVLLVGATGVLSARLLRGLTDSMALRYGLAVLVAYGAFFALVWLWLRYLTRALRDEAPEDALPREAPALVGSLGEPTQPHKSGVSLYIDGTDVADAAQAVAWSVDGRSNRRSVDLPDLSGVGGGGGGGGGGGSGGGGGLSLDVGDGEGLAVVVILVVVAVVAVVVLGAAAWCIWEAPVILGEAAFELALASALARASRTLEGRSWSHALLRSTWKPALVVLALAVLGGAMIQAVCPGVTTFHAAWDRCVVHRGEAPSP